MPFYLVNLEYRFFLDTASFQLWGHHSSVFFSQTRGGSLRLFYSLSMFGSRSHNRAIGFCSFFYRNVLYFNFWRRNWLGSHVDSFLLILFLLLCRVSKSINISLDQKILFNLQRWIEFLLVLLLRSSSARKTTPSCIKLARWNLEKPRVLFTLFELLKSWCVDLCVHSFVVDSQIALVERDRSLEE